MNSLRWIGSICILLLAVGCVADRDPAQQLTSDDAQTVNDMQDVNGALDVTTVVDAKQRFDVFDDHIPETDPVTAWVQYLLSTAEAYQQGVLMSASEFASTEEASSSSVEFNDRNVFAGGQVARGDANSGHFVSAGGGSGVPQESTSGTSSVASTVADASGQTSTADPAESTSTQQITESVDEQPPKDVGSNDDVESSIAAVLPSTTAVDKPQVPQQSAGPQPPQQTGPLLPTPVQPTPSAPMPNPAPVEPTEPSDQNAPLVTVTLVILGPTGQQVYPVTIEDGSTVEEVMVAAQAQGLTMELQAFGGMGAYVASINGVAEDLRNQMVWIFRINGEKSVMGISSAVVHGGETIQWVYEKMF